ncbi:MAG TPA: translocation/assembly module TamB domain-containing protein [bacterium]|nr:translocation/assembly module TamB domain-containing protein [bacterium]
MARFSKKALLVLRDASWILLRLALAFVRVLGVVTSVVLVGAFALAFALYGAGYFHSLVDFAIEKYTSDYTRTECRVGRVEGTLLTGVDIYDFAIGDGPSLTRDGAALVIDEIHVRYNPLHFMRRDVVIDRVHCVRPRLLLKEDPDGRVNLDRIFGAKGPPEGKGVYFEIVNVYLEDAYFRMLVGGPLSEFADADIECTFTKARGAVFIDLRHCSCYLPEFGQRILHFGSGSLAINERLMHFSGVDAASHITRIRTDGTIKFKPEVHIELEFEADPIDFGEALQGAFDDPPEVFGRGRYSGSLVGTTERLVQKGSLTVDDAYIYGFDVRDVFAYYDVDIATRQVRLRGFEGRVNETPVYAKMTVDLSNDRPVYWGEARLLRVNLADYVHSSFLETDVDVRLQFAGAGARPDDYAVDVSLHLGPGQLGPLIIDGGNADIRYASSRVYISGLFLRLGGGGDFYVKGDADPEALDLEIQARFVPVERFAAEREWRGLEGAVSVDGRIFGSYKHPSFEGGVVFKDFAYGRVKCGVARAEGYWKDIGADDRGEVRFMAWDVSVGPLRLARAYGDLDAEDGVYVFRNGYIESVKGSNVRFDLAYDSRQGRMELTSLTLDLGETEAELMQPLVVSREKGRGVLSGGILKFRGGEFGLAGSFGLDGGPLALEIEARGVPLDELLPAEVGPSLGGTLDRVRLDIGGTMDAPSFYASVAASNVFFGRQPIDYIEGEVSYEHNRLTVPGLVAGLAGGTLRAAAYLPLSALAGEGDEPLDVTLRFSKFKLAALTSLYKEGLAEEGFVDGVITATGTASSPTVRANFLLSEARWGGVYFAKGRADFTYRDGVVSIREISLSESTLPNVVVTGELPLDLRKGEGSPLGGEMELRADFTDLDLRALNPLTDEVLITGGKVRGRLELGGTYRTPAFKGRVEVLEGEGVVSSLRSSFSNLSGAFEARGDSVVVPPEDPITFDLDEGRGRAWGSVSFEAVKPLELDLSVSLEDYVVRAISGVQASGDVEASINGPVDRLRATAEVRLSSGLITIGFGGESKAGGPPSSGGFDYEVHVLAPGNLWLRNKDAEIELEADVVFRRTGAATYYAGELHARRGYYYFLKRDFTVEKADIILTGTEELNPVINLQAKHVIRAVRPGNADAVVYVDVTGTLREPEVTLRYELTSGQTVGLAQDEIMKVLALDVTWEDYNDLSSSELASKGSSDYVRHYAEAEVSRAVRRETGVDVFEFDANVFRGEQQNPYAEFTVGQHLTHDLFVSYTGKYREEVSGARELEHSAEVDYELKRDFYVVGSTFEDEGSQRYGLGLRFIHKY